MGKLPKNVALVQVHQGVYFGFRYTCRDEAGKVVRTAPRDFRSRHQAIAEARRYWPGAKITTEVI